MWQLSTMWPDYIKPFIDHKLRFAFSFCIAHVCVCMCLCLFVKYVNLINFPVFHLLLLFGGIVVSTVLQRTCYRYTQREKLFYRRAGWNLNELQEWNVYGPSEGTLQTLGRPIANKKIDLKILNWTEECLDIKQSEYNFLYTTRMEF